MGVDRPAEPWFGFLCALDAALDGPVDLHFIGGFVVSQFYGFARKTADLDVVTVTPRESSMRVTMTGGRESALREKYKVYIDPVGVAS